MAQLMEGLQFLRPQWLLALPPLLLLFWSLWRRRHGATPWAAVVDPHLLRRLLIAGSPVAVRRQLIPLGLAWLLAVLALAGPSWQRLPPLQYRPQVPPLVIALDLSRSMSVRDLSPSRLAVAKAKLHQLLQRLSHRPVALLVFSATAHRALPFTEDRQLLLDTLSRMQPQLMPARGSRPSAAVALAAQIFERYESKGGDLLLLTDGTDPAAEAAAHDLAARGHRLSVLALGTTAGGPVPDGDDGYLRSAGRPAISSLDLDALGRLADAGGGIAHPVSVDDRDLRALIGVFGKPGAAAGGTEAGEGETARDAGPWLLPPLLLLSLWLFRRGSALVLLLALGLHDSPALAWELSGLFLNDEQRALRALQDGWPGQAAAGFSDPRWQGVALYRNGDYRSALERFERDDSATGHYNRGNTLVFLGRLAEAAAAYERALALQPGMEDALHNLALVRRGLATQGPPPPLEVPRTPEEPSRPQQPRKPRPAETAEELLDAPGDLRHAPPEGDKDQGLRGIGNIGGGAMLVKGAEHAHSSESSSIGQGLNEGEAPSTGEDRVARRGGSAAAEEGDSAARETASSHLPQAPQSPSESDRQNGGSPTQPSSENADNIDGKEQDAQAAAATGSTDTSADGGTRRGQGSAHMDSETLQALHHWMNGIEDNPGGLLQEKFRLEYQRRTRHPDPGEPW